jgi:ABC-type sugar transport system ATPase subunit
MCAPITSGEADTWKYLKDDILKVVVWDIIDKVFKEIKQPIMTVRMLLDNLYDKVWDLFAKGYTATLNQIDGSWATEMVMQYKPRTLEELSMFTGAIRPNFASFRDNFINRIPQSTGSVELDEVLKQKTKTLSGGWQRKVSIAISLINDPKVLFLDEPTLGLDVIARRELWKVIQNLKGKITIVLTTHYMEEAESLSDRIGIISKGELIRVGTSKELIKETKTKNFEDAFVKIAGGEELC